jgi:hypothetical protein
MLLLLHLLPCAKAMPLNMSCISTTAGFNQYAAAAAAAPRFAPAALCEGHALWHELHQHHCRLAAPVEQLAQ